MTSETLPSPGYPLLEAPTRAFVFVAMADGWQPAGRIDLLARSDGIAEAGFLYSRSWRAREDGFSLDPVNLIIPERVAEQVAAPLHGVFQDAGPDAWGRRLLDDRFRRLFDAARPEELRGTPHRLPNEIDRLLLGGDDRVGSLAFGLSPSAPLINPAETGLSTLSELEEAMVLFDDGKRVPEAIQRLAGGTSLGGARPKASVSDADGGLWLAKFRRTSDTFDVIRAEHATMTLAQMAGISAAETRVIQLGAREALLVRRFDRIDPTKASPSRISYLSALTLLGLSETSLNGSYAQIADRMQKVGIPPEDRAQLFRRMAFNVAMGNTDDHLRNHGFLRLGGTWRLSPAFDVLPCPDGPPNQAISVGVVGGDPSTANVLSRHARFGLAKEEAEAIVDEVYAVTTGWRAHFSAHGVPDASIQRIERCIGRLAPREGGPPSPGRP